MTTNTINTDPVVGRAEAAKYLGISVNALDRLTRTGRLHPLRITYRVQFRVSELERFLSDASTNGGDR